MENIKISILISLIGIIIISCQKDEVKPDDLPVTENNIEVSENVIDIDKFETLSLISNDADLKSGIYKYQMNGSNIPDLKTNSIIVSGKEEGYARRVNQIIKTSSSITLYTSEASLTDIFKNGDITLDFDYIDLRREKKNFSSEEMINEDLSNGVTTKDNIEYKFDTDFNSNLKLRGGISFNPHFKFQMRFNNHELEYLKIAIENTNLTINPILLINSQGSINMALERTLGNIDKRFKFIAGGIPVVMDLSVSLIGSVRAQFDGNTQTTLSYVNKSIANLGVERINGSNNYIGNFQNNSSLNSSIDLQSEGQITLYVIPQIYVEFYKSLSTILKAEPYIELFSKANANQNEQRICAEINAGIDFTASFGASILGFNIINESKSFEGTRQNLWKSEQNCKLQILKIKEPTYVSSEPSPCFFSGYNYDVLYYFTHPYQYEDNNILSDPSQMRLFWRDNRNLNGELNFALTNTDPYQSISSKSFTYGVCVSWEDRESYELSGYVTDNKGNRSNYVSWIIIE